MVSKKDQKLQFNPKFSIDSGRAPPEWSFVPSGLEILTTLRYMVIRQLEDEPASTNNIDLKESLNTIVFPNFYLIQDEHGNRIFNVREKTDPNLIIEKGNSRRYLFTVFGIEDTEVLHIQRMFSFSSDGVECVLPDGTLVGGIRSSCTDCVPCFCRKRYYKVYDTSNTVVLYIVDEGCCSREFPVVKATDRSNVVAYITKRFEELAIDSNTRADCFILEFKGVHEISPVLKALLVGGIFFLDFKYFEEPRAGQRTVKSEDLPPQIIAAASTQNNAVVKPKQESKKPA